LVTYSADTSKSRQRNMNASERVCTMVSRSACQPEFEVLWIKCRMARQTAPQESCVATVATARHPFVDLSKSPLVLLFLLSLSLLQSRHELSKLEFCYYNYDNMTNPKDDLWKLCTHSENYTLCLEKTSPLFYISINS